MISVLGLLLKYGIITVISDKFRLLIKLAASIRIRLILVWFGFEIVQY